MAENFTVLAQRHTVGRLPDESFGRVVQVTFRTSRGVVAAVDVPAAHYTAEVVRAAVEAMAAELDKVADL